MTEQSDTSAVIWLARREVSRQRLSYLVTGMFLLFMGAISASIIEAGALGSADVLESRASISADLIMLLLTTLLATNITLWGSYADWKSPAERNLVLLRTLPIPTSTLIGSRMLAMSVSLLINVPAFFLPIYLLSDIEMGGMAYLAFVVFWIGYALIWAGLSLYIELVAGSKVYFWFSALTTVVLVGVIILLNAVLDIELVSAVGNRANDSALLTNLVALTAGIAVFVVAGRVSERGLREREISA